MTTVASWAGHLAQALLQESLPRRWAHVQGVAARARGLALVLGADADLLEAAAWLHDIGYAPGLAVTGLHALDGARYLRDARHADAMLFRLVAHHSYAIVEAHERGLADVLALEFEPAPYALSSVLTCCDMTTSPDGELVPAERRLAEIHDRYGPGQPVNPACDADDPPRSRAGSRPSPNGISLQTDKGNACRTLRPAQDSQRPRYATSDSHPMGQDTAALLHYCRRPVWSVAACGLPSWNRVQLAPGLAPKARSISSN
jgi:hypothetical protein